MAMSITVTMVQSSSSSTHRTFVFVWAGLNIYIYIYVECQMTTTIHFGGKKLPNPPPPPPPQPPSQTWKNGGWFGWSARRVPNNPGLVWSGPPGGLISIVQASKQASRLLSIYHISIELMYHTVHTVYIYIYMYSCIYCMYKSSTVPNTVLNQSTIYGWLTD